MCFDGVIAEMGVDKSLSEIESAAEVPTLALLFSLLFFFGKCRATSAVVSSSKNREFLSRERRREKVGKQGRSTEGNRKERKKLV